MHSCGVAELLACVGCGAERLQRSLFYWCALEPVQVFVHVVCVCIYHVSVHTILTEIIARHAASMSESYQCFIYTCNRVMASSLTLKLSGRVVWMS